MSQINDIKNMYENERLSFEEISKQTGLNWRTVKKYALIPPEHISKKQIRPKRQTAIEASGLNQLIDDWLIEDQKVPRKQIRTAKRIHLELVNSYGFTGSYRSTASYVQKQKICLEIKKVKKYEHISSPPGQAQSFLQMKNIYRAGFFHSCIKERKLTGLPFPKSGQSNHEVSYIHAISNISPIKSTFDR